MYKIIAFCKWCQDLPLPELATHLKATGVDGVDLPCRPGASIEPGDAPKMLPEAKKVFEDHGLSLDRIVTGIQEANEESDRQLEAIRSIGVEKIRLGGYSVQRDEAHNARKYLDEGRRKLDGIEEQLKKHEIRGGIQNHSGMALEVNASSTLWMIQDRDPNWIGVQCDPGHLTLSGEPLALALGLMGPYLHSVNFKSPRQEFFADKTTGKLTYQPIWTPLKDGMLDVAAALKLLNDAGYADPISIHGEYRTHYHRIEDYVEATGKLIAEDVEYIRGEMRKSGIDE